MRRATKGLIALNKRTLRMHTHLHMQSPTKFCTTSPNPLEKSEGKAKSSMWECFSHLESEETLLCLWQYGAEVDRSVSECSDMLFHHTHILLAGRENERCTTNLISFKNHSLWLSELLSDNNMQYSMYSKTFWKWLLHEYPCMFEWWSDAFLVSYLVK